MSQEPGYTLPGTVFGLRRRTLFTCSGKFAGDTGINNSRFACSRQRGSRDEDDTGRRLRQNPSQRGRSRSPDSTLGHLNVSCIVSILWRSSATVAFCGQVWSTGAIPSFRAPVRERSNISRAWGRSASPLRLVSLHRIPANTPAVFDGAAFGGNFPGLLGFGVFSDLLGRTCFNPATARLNP